MAIHIRPRRLIISAAVALLWWHIFTWFEDIGFMQLCYYGECTAGFIEYLTWGFFAFCIVAGIIAAVAGVCWCVWEWYKWITIKCNGRN